MTVAFDPVPAIAPGFIVHVPVAGRPLNTTLPVGFEQEEGKISYCSTAARSGDCPRINSPVAIW